MYTILGIEILTTGKRTSGTWVNPSDREIVIFDYITNRILGYHRKHLTKHMNVVPRSTVNTNDETEN